MQVLFSHGHLWGYTDDIPVRSILKSLSKYWGIHVHRKTSVKTVEISICLFQMWRREVRRCRPATGGAASRARGRRGRGLVSTIGRGWPESTPLLNLLPNMIKTLLDFFYCLFFFAVCFCVIWELIVYEPRRCFQQVSPVLNVTIVLVMVLPLGHYFLLDSFIIAEKFKWSLKLFFFFCTHLTKIYENLLKNSKVCPSTVQLKNTL